MLRNFESIIAAILAIASCLATMKHSADGPKTADAPRFQERLKSGRAFRTACHKRLSVFRQNEPLHQFVSGLSRNQSIAIFVDRRIDNSQLIDFDGREKSPLVILFELGADRNAAPAMVGDSIFFGPASVSASLPYLENQLKQQINKLPKPLQKKWLHRELVSWPRLSRPRQLLAELFNRNGLTLEGADAIEHDLWRQQALPRMAVYRQACLLVVGFGKWIKISDDGKSAKVVDFPNLESVSISYETTKAADLAKAVQKAFPQAKVRKTKRTVSVSLPIAEHTQVAKVAATSNMSRPTQSGDKLIVSLKVDGGQIGSILNSVATKLRVELDYDESLVPVLRQRVSFDLKDVPYEELIAKTLEGQPVSFQLTKERLILRKK